MDIVFLDKEITLWLNSFNCSFADVFFHLATGIAMWIPLYVMLLWLIFKRQGAQGLVTVLFIGLVVLLADQISSSIIKPIFERYRPSHDPVLQYMVHIVNGYRGGLYGFCSSHAANSFGIATFLALVMRKPILNFSLFIWALISCYSRIYLGVHFLGDIICGALLGMIVARLVYELYLHASLHFFVINHHNKWTLKQGIGQMFGDDEPNVVALIFWVTIILVIIICNSLLKYYGIAC